MARLTKRELIGVVAETTQGTLATFTSANTVAGACYFWAEGVEITLNSENLERNYFRNTMDPISIVKGKKSAEIKFKTELLYTSATTETATMSAIFNACGLVGAANIYAPVSVPPNNFQGLSKSCSIEVYKDGAKHQFRGCVGDIKISYEAGKIVMLECSFKGQLINSINFAVTSALPTVHYLNKVTGVNNIVAKSIPFTFDSYTSFIVSKIEILMGNEIVERTNIEELNGVAGFSIIGRKPMMNISIEATTFATYDLLNAFENATEAAAIVGEENSSYYISMPKAQVISANYTDIGGILGHDVGFQLNTSTADDCITITETES